MSTGKKNVTLTLLSFLLVVLTFTLSACSLNTNAGALEYMEQKYGEKFECVKSWGSSYTTSGIRKIMVSCNSLPGKEILVVIEGKGKSESYSDNYMDFYYEAQTSNYIKQVASKYFTDFTFDINIGAVSSAAGITSETKFDEYIHNEKNFVSANIDIGSSNENTVKEFLNELKRLGIHFSFGIDIISTNEGYTAQYFYDSNDIYLEKREI